MPMQRRALPRIPNSRLDVDSATASVVIAVAVSGWLNGGGCDRRACLLSRPRLGLIGISGDDRLGNGGGNTGDTHLTMASYVKANIATLQARHFAEQSIGLL